MKRIAAVLLAIATAVVLFAHPLYAIWAALVAVAVAWILDPFALRVGFRFGAVLGIVFAAAITAAVVAWAEGPQRGLELGGMVLLRLLVLMVAATVLVRAVNAEKLLQATEKLGMERLGLVLGLALNSLPRLADASSDVWMATRVRSDRTLARMRGLPRLGEVLLAHTGRIAEEAAAAASLRGHSSLTRTGEKLRTAVRVVVVTGPGDSGKTGAVRSVAEKLRASGVEVSGFIQPGDYQRGRKVGFLIRDLSTGAEISLATLGDRSKGAFGTRFRFSDEGFRLGREALSQTISQSVVIVDELGPVELRGRGHMPAVRRALKTSDLLGAVIVVRRTLVPSLLAELDASDAVVIDVEDLGTGAADAIIEGLGDATFKRLNV